MYSLNVHKVVYIYVFQRFMNKKNHNAKHQNKCEVSTEDFASIYKNERYAETTVYLWSYAQMLFVSVMTVTLIVCLLFKTLQDCLQIAVITFVSVCSCLVGY